MALFPLSVHSIAEEVGPRADDIFMDVEGALKLVLAYNYGEDFAAEYAKKTVLEIC